MRVLAIGGSASVGKTTLAADLADRLGLSNVAHVDDVIPEFEADVRPSFLVSTPSVWCRSADWLRDELVEWTARLHPHIECLVSDALGRGGGTIEGEGIGPRIARRWDGDVVRVVYVVETDPDVLYRTFAGRTTGARFLALSDTERRGVVEMNRRYGEWLRTAADAHGQPLVSSQPWTTLPERTLEATGVAPNASLS
jgi:hypothetical protein